MNATTRESDIFGTPLAVDLVGAMADGRWYSKPALGRLTGYGKNHINGLVQRMLRQGWVEAADNPHALGSPNRQGVSLWKTGRHTAPGMHPEWPRGTPRRLYRVTDYGRRQADRARLWAALGLSFHPVAGRAKGFSWRRGCVWRAIGRAIAAEDQGRRSQGRGEALALPKRPKRGS